MDLKEFRKLDAKKKVDLVNQRLSEISNIKDFSCETLSFSYKTAVEEMRLVGHERKGDEFVRSLGRKELDVLFKLADNFDGLMDSRYNLGTKVVESSNLKTTTFKIDAKVLEKWQSYCKKHSDFSAPGLLAAALNDFMKYN